MDEAEVEHLVGLVEDKYLDRRKIDRSLVGKIDQAAGRGDEHIDAAGEILLVAADRGAAEHGGDLEMREPGVVARAGGDLAGKLARRGEDQHAARTWTWPLVGGNQPVDRRQHEGRGLAGAGLGDAEQVAPGENSGDCLRLDRRRAVIALQRQRLNDGLRQPEIFE